MSQSWKPTFCRLEPTLKMADISEGDAMIKDAMPDIREQYLKVAILVKHGVPFDYAVNLDAHILQALYEAFAEVFGPK